MRSETGVEEKDFYQLLGLERSASKEEIKKAYRDLSRIFHPDSNFYSDIIDQPVSPKHVELFEKVTEAYNTLMEEESRATYDRTLLTGKLKTWEDGEKETKVVQTKWDMSAAATPMGGFGSRAFAVGVTGTPSEVNIQSAPVIEIIRQRKLLFRIMRFLRLA
ncbi:MAG: DnaJ domain-containing protein [Oligoflexia bacterium]|nr:DnaJ domain-containing protein [Oligoflexia bacterium]